MFEPTIPKLLLPALHTFDDESTVIYLSATITPATLALLDIDPADVTFETISSTFPLNRRPIYLRSAARVDFRSMQHEYVRERWLGEIDSIIAPTWAMVAYEDRRGPRPGHPVIDWDERTRKDRDKHSHQAWDRSQEFLDAASGDMPQPWRNVTIGLLAEHHPVNVIADVLATLRCVEPSIRDDAPNHGGDRCLLPLSAVPPARAGERAVSSLL